MPNQHLTQELATLDRGKLPKHLTQSKIELIELAVMVGWSLHIDSNGVTCTIRSPRGNKAIHVGRRNTIPEKRMVKQIVTWGDPEKVAIVRDAKRLPDSVLVSLPIPGDEGTITVHEDEDEPEVVEVASSTRPEPVEMPDGRTYVDAEPTVVSEKPLLARANARTGYQSDTTIIRKWSDGSTDYKCTLCDYVSADRLGPSRHYGSAHTAGQGTTPRPPTFKAEVEGATYAPRQARVFALAEYLNERLADVDWVDLDMTRLAREALTWQHEQSKAGTQFAAEAEDLSDGDVLNRIRRLLDTGQMAEQQARVEELETRLVQAEERATKGWDAALVEQDRARRAEETLDTLADLVSGLRKESSGEPDTH